MRSNRIHLIGISVFVVALIAFTVLRSGSAPTEKERNQMTVLSDQLFVFDGVTNRIKRTRTIDAFDRQHEMIPYLRLVSTWFETFDMPKDRPVSVMVRGDRILVTWPISLEEESRPIRWGPSYAHRAYIDKKTMSVLKVSQGR